MFFLSFFYNRVEKEGKIPDFMPENAIMDFFRKKSVKKLFLSSKIEFQTHVGKGYSFVFAV